MKQFFSLVINHEYDRIDENIRGNSNDLTIVPARMNDSFINKNRLWFRNQSDRLNCYIEDDESIKNETDILFFWVVCTNEVFYNYTDYPNNINFYNPFYSWSNSEAHKTLQKDEQCFLHPGRPPKNAIGCIAILIHNIDTSEKIEFTVDFKTRKTYWQYHVMTNEDSKDKRFAIMDLTFQSINNQNDLENKANNIEEWKFEKIPNENTTEIIFRSNIPLPYFKKAQKRLELEWESKQISNQQDNQKMILPYANYLYKMVDNDNKELTPIYIYI
ncbi:hypothetical protein WNY78_18320 [Psychroserpens sp. AS72]|uniref:hypothetical protein n=1 Tax=Psychroserpens sp. AS72 TaxID=3135775 RepID=UPI00317B506A